MKRLFIPLMSLLLVVGCNSNLEPKKVSLIPQPVKLDVKAQGTYILEPKATIAYQDDALKDVATYMAENIKKMTSLDLTVAYADKGDITLTTNLANEKAEAYTMKVSQGGIEINGAAAAGIIMATSTLQQLIPEHCPQGAAVPYVEIEDYPRFDYRGVHLDVSRHFYTKEQVKDLLDLMARYKLNKFHWHLTDDQGWRIEIKQYPMLVDSGAYRRFNNHDRECQLYAKTQQEDSYIIPEELMKINGRDTLYGGYYTQDDIREVVAYAAQRNIDVLPEIDMPGHLMGAIMGYPYISCLGKAQWGASFSDPLCVGNDQALEFVKNIYTEVAGLFPYEYMHLGADEVEKTRWKACEKCQARMKAEGLTTEEELQAWFVHDMEKHFNSLGKKLMGWDEIIEGGLSETATIMWWRNWAPDAVPQATSSGNKVVMSPCFEMYFDLGEGPKTLRSCYEFDPVLPKLDEQQAQHILGVQGNIWCERIPTVSRMHHQSFPRMLALAETGWSQKETKDWDSFFDRFIAEADFLDAKDINYRIPNITGFENVNVFTDSIRIELENPLPNIAIRYTTDGSIPTINSELYTQPITLRESTEFAFRGFRPNGTTGETFRASYRKENYMLSRDVNPTGDGMQVKWYNYKGVKKEKQCHLINKEGTLERTYVIDSMVMGKEIKGYMGVIATGYIDIAEDGIYKFALTCNGGATMSIDDTFLIDNDGTHGEVKVTAQKALAKGWHKIEVRYFSVNNGGSVRLEMDGKLIDEYKH
ncbi:MAG: family 20 glycosylhydrolase [Rikenellaceae bacterium]